MVRVGHADLGIGAIALLARELERDDARDVSLERQHLEIEHQLRVIGERRGDAHRTIQVGRRVVHRTALGALNLPLDLADALEVLIDANAIGSAHALLEPPDVFHDLVEQFWPGPLTVILPAAKSVPLKITAGTRKVGVRCPAAGFATRLVKRFGYPITATSANRSGLPSAITAEEVREQLDEAVDALIDGGSLPSRGGSTLIDLTVDPPSLLREGPISFETLQHFFEGRIWRDA